MTAYEKKAYEKAAKELIKISSKYQERVKREQANRDKKYIVVKEIELHTMNDIQMAYGVGYFNEVQRDRAEERLRAAFSMDGYEKTMNDYILDIFSAFIRECQEMVRQAEFDALTTEEKERIIEENIRIIKKRKKL